MRKTQSASHPDRKLIGLNFDRAKVVRFIFDAKGKIKFLLGPLFRNHNPFQKGFLSTGYFNLLLRLSQDLKSVSIQSDPQARLGNLRLNTNLSFTSILFASRGLFIGKPDLD